MSVAAAGARARARAPGAAGGARAARQARVVPRAAVAVSGQRRAADRFNLSREQLEIVESLDGWADEKLIPMLKPVEKSWQPQDFLPDPSSGEEFLDAIRDIQERCADIPDEVIVSVVGDMITEEALPTYQSMLNTLDGTKDNTGADTGAWARWTRAWTAEENRHGDLMNKYLWMTGRVDMVAVERTIQYLIGSGMDPKTDNNPYLGYLYTSFQERATKISHSNTRLLARAAGDDMLGKICGLVAADEARHEAAYQMVVEKLFSVDPEGTMAAYEDMMRKQIVMPAHLMYDGENENLWTEFSAVAEKQGVYTAMDYADIVEHLNKKWKIADMAVLGDAGASQEYLLKLPARIRRLAERAEKRAKSLNKEPVDARISWVYNRPVKM